MRATATLAACAVCGTAISGAALGQTTVDLDAIDEATIFENGLAIGTGQVFSGRSQNGETRRGLIRFDLSALPSGDVTSATLTLLVVNQRGAAPLNAHRLLADWNEGPAAAGGGGGGQGSQPSADDATWTETGLGTPWSSAGGDFEPAATDSQFSPFAGSTVNFDVTADVAAFADGSADNFGWIIISDLETVSGNVVGISTDDNGFPAITLSVTVEEAEVCLPDTNLDGEVTPADFNAWIAAFNTQSPQCDQNGDNECTPADFNAWIANFNAGCP